MTRPTIASLQAHIAKLERELATFPQRVADRVELVLKARQIAPSATFADCVTDAEVKARAVGQVRGFDALDGKSPEWIAAHWDALLEQAQADPVRRLLADRHRRH